MPLTKEEKFMATRKATIKRDKVNAYLVLETGNKSVEIILTDDNPANITAVFNSLLKELKKGLIQFDLEDGKDDLYFHICKEYIKQLNAEMKEVYRELEDYHLLEK